MAKDWDYYKKEHIAKELRGIELWYYYIEKKYESPIERIAYMHLVFLANDHFEPAELQIFPQAEIGPYRVDFLILHRDTDTWVVVECDGHDYHERTKEQAAHDKKRDRFMTKQGYTVLRYTGSQICDNPMEIYEDVGSIIFEKQRALRKRGVTDGGETDGE